jgi:hypothetical protein
MEEKMKKSVIAVIAAGIAASAMVASPALAAKVEKWDGQKDITVGGKSYTVSGKRTKVTIKGKAGSRDAIKVGMDCSVKAKGKELTSISCK